MNEDVKSLGSVQLINDRCVDMQRSKHGMHGNMGCVGRVEVAAMWWDCNGHGDEDCYPEIMAKQALVPSSGPLLGQECSCFLGQGQGPGSEMFVPSLYGEDKVKFQSVLLSPQSVAREHV